MILQPILGREAEIEAILDRLDDPETRLLTLLGPGGVGKTRLAMEVAQRAGPRFANGARILAFAGVPEADLIPSFLARELDIVLAPGDDVLEQVIDTLASLHILLVFDNMEHLAAGAALLLTDIAGSCPRLKILATSRAPLRVSGELRHELPPLSIPPISELTVDNTGPAVELFALRSRAARPEFRIDAKTLEAVAAICRTVDGLPLAIELAAARSSVLSPAAILERLDRRFDLLNRSHRASPARHQSLLNAIAWSYDLLPVPAQALFRQMAVFVDGFDLDAATGVDARIRTAMDQARTFEDLSTLVDHHLVRVSGRDDLPRYTLLESIREFGLEILAASGEGISARDAHAAYFRYLALQFGPEAAGPRAHQVVPALRANWANIRQAAIWLAENARVDDAVAMYSSLYTFLLREDHVEEARDALESWLVDPHIGDEGRAIAVLRSGCLSNYLAERDRSEPRIAEAIAIFRANGDHKHLATALVLGIPEPANPDEFAQSVARCREGLAIARKVGDPLVASNALYHLAWTSVVEHRHDDAIALTREWIDLARNSGMELNGVNAAVFLAGLLIEQGNLDEAEVMLVNAASTFRRLDVRLSLHDTILQLAQIAIERGDLAKARARIEPAVKSAREQGSIRELAPAIQVLAELSLRERDWDQAIVLAQEGLRYWERKASLSGIACSLDVIAQVAAHQGDARQAAIMHGASEGLERQVGYEQDPELRTNARQVVTETAGKLLGAEAFQAAIDEGAALPVEDAIALATSWQLPASAGQPSSAPPDLKGLSEREIEVLRLMCDGLSNAAIASTLGISAHTVTVHVSHILARLNVSSRTAAVAWAIRSGVA